MTNEVVGRIKRQRYSQAVTIQKKAIRSEQALLRETIWRQYTPAEQLAMLDERLGVGKGATKQRARIQALIVEA